MPVKKKAAPKKRAPRKKPDTSTLAGLIALIRAAKWGEAIVVEDVDGFDYTVTRADLAEAVEHVIVPEGIDGQYGGDLISLDDWRAIVKTVNQKPEVNYEVENAASPDGGSRGNVIHLTAKEYKRALKAKATPATTLRLPTILGYDGILDAEDGELSFGCRRYSIREWRNGEAALTLAGRTGPYGGGERFAYLNQPGAVSAVLDAVQAKLDERTAPKPKAKKPAKRARRR